jgi:hypothetical protein
MKPSIVWLKPADAAKHICLSKQRLAKLRLMGTGPQYHKVGRSVLYDRAVLDSWIASHRCRSTSERLPRDHSSNGCRPRHRLHS